MIETNPPEQVRGPATRDEAIGLGRLLTDYFERVGVGVDADTDSAGRAAEVTRLVTSAGWAPTHRARLAIEIVPAEPEPSSARTTADGSVVLHPTAEHVRVPEAALTDTAQLPNAVTPAAASEQVVELPEPCGCAPPDEPGALGARWSCPHDRTWRWRASAGGWVPA